MIAIGGSIGAGFFVGSGGALARGVSHTVPNRFLCQVTCLHFFQGPASVLIDFAIIGIMMFNVGKLLVPVPVLADLCH
jgi:amino acid transporter